MKRHQCTPELVAPRIDVSIDEFNDDEIATCKKLAEEFTRIAAHVGRDLQRTYPPCSTAGDVRSLLRALPEASRKAALEALEKRCGEARGKRADAPDVAPKLRKSLRRLFRRRVDGLRPAIEKVFEAVAAQRPKAEALFPGTSVDFRLAGEEDVKWHLRTQIASPENLTCRWRTEVAGAQRGYWELRGPVWGGYAGKLLGHGFLQDGLQGEEVGGFFDLALADYLPAEAPQMALRYHLRVLPLPAAGELSYGLDFGYSTTPLSEFEPTAPEGAGPWSHAAVIEYGRNFAQAPAPLDIDSVAFYRKLRLNINSFKVDADQSGPGTEEYHVRGFVVQHQPSGKTTHSNFHRQFTIPEGDKNKRDMGERVTVDLGPPLHPDWPKLFLVVLSVMEEDAGAELAEWEGDMNGLLWDFLHGEIGDEIRDVIADMQDEIRDAAKEYRDEMRATAVAVISGAIGAAATKLAVLFVLFAAALIGGFLHAGSRDDFFGIHLHKLTLTTSQAKRLHNALNEPDDATRSGRLANSKAVAAGADFKGVVDNGRFTVNETRIQFFGMGLPDSASNADGIVSIGLNWEFFEQEFRNL